MYLIDKIKQGYKEAYHDREIIIDELHKQISNADYYEKKCLEEAELMIEIEYPLQIASRVMGRDYWHIDKNGPK